MKVRKSAFSLVEVLAAIAVIGIITFLAIPNIVQVKTDSENGLALARAASLNMAMASYLKDQGTLASSSWNPANTNTCYTALTPYLAFAPADFDKYVPAGYTFTFPATLSSPMSVIFPGETNVRLVY